MKPTLEEVPLLQVDVPIMSVAGGSDVANCELISEPHVVIKGVAKLNPKPVPLPSNNGDAADQNQHQDEDSNNTRIWQSPQNVLVDVTVLDDGSSQFAPICAVRRSGNSERALPMKPAGTTPSALFVQVPAVSRTHFPNLMRFDVGLLPRTTKDGGEQNNDQQQQQQQPPTGESSSEVPGQQKQSLNSSADAASSSSPSPLLNSSSGGGGVDDSEEPEVIAIDFDLFSIRDERTGELAEAVEIPVTESISIAPRFTARTRHLILGVLFGGQMF